MDVSRCFPSKKHCSTAMAWSVRVGLTNGDSFLFSRFAIRHVKDDGRNIVVSE